VDHRLRPDSAEDAAFVERVLVAWGVPVCVLRADPDRLAAARAAGPESAARAERRRLLRGHADAIGAQHIVTAHTADDQAETVLMRIATGAGLTGLAGIPSRTGRWVRPWLEVRRPDVRAWAESVEVPWREDPTNDEQRFLRNRLRAVLAPAMESVFGNDWQGRCARSASHARIELDALTGLGESYLAEVMRLAPPAILLDRGRLEDADPALRAWVLRRALRQATDLRVVARHLGRLEEAFLPSGPRKVGLPDGLEARAWGRWLGIGPRAERPPSELLVGSVGGPGRWPIGPWTLVVRAADGRVPTAIDPREVPLPWRVAPAPRGCRYQPHGAPGGRRIGRAWTDARVPAAVRPWLPLLWSGDRPIWAPGLRPTVPPPGRIGLSVHLEGRGRHPLPWEVDVWTGIGVGTSNVEEVAPSLR
jgi:tRNA(Ile)-lysidine synthase